MTVKEKIEYVVSTHRVFLNELLIKFSEVGLIKAEYKIHFPIGTIIIKID